MLDIFNKRHERLSLGAYFVVVVFLLGTITTAAVLCFRASFPICCTSRCPCNFSAFKIRGAFSLAHVGIAAMSVFLTLVSFFAAGLNLDAGIILALCLALIVTTTIVVPRAIVLDISTALALLLVLVLASTHACATVLCLLTRLVLPRA
jgi:hypothetical protein